MRNKDQKTESYNLEETPKLTPITPETETHGGFVKGTLEMWGGKIGTGKSDTLRKTIGKKKILPNEPFDLEL